MKTAVVIAAHGSRRPGGLPEVELEAIARMVRDRSGEIVKYGALQFTRPTVEEAMSEAVAEGAERIVVVPLFIFAGNHVARDLPEILAKLRVAHPSVDIAWAPHIGADERLADIVVDRVKGALAGV